MLVPIPAGAEPEEGTSSPRCHPPAPSAFLLLLVVPRLEVKPGGAARLIDPACKLLRHLVKGIVFPRAGMHPR